MQTQYTDTHTYIIQIQEYKYKIQVREEKYIIYIHYIYNYLLTHIVKFATVADQFINKNQKETRKGRIRKEKRRDDKANT